MPNTRELRRRIKSVKNTAQITKAMQMVAATKMRRAQNQALSGRPYITTLAQSLNRLLPKVNITSHPLLQPKEGIKNTAVLVLTTDKSLCGALNTNVFRTVQTFSKEHNNLIFYTVGKKGRQFLIKTGKTITADFENTDRISLRTASQISKLLISEFLSSNISQSYVIFPDFISTLRQEPKIAKLLPIDPSFIDDIKSLSQLENIKLPRHTAVKKIDFSSEEVIFEPGINTLLDYILNHYLQIKVFQSLLESKASEHSARMMAMQNATDNAKELVEDLQLQYNQTRQSSITTELLEITSAQAALE